MRDWHKVYRKMTLDRKFVSADLSLRGGFLTLLLTSDDNGSLPDLDDVAYVQRVPVEELQRTVVWLNRAGWVKDGVWTKWSEYQPESSAERTRAYRERQKLQRDCDNGDVTNVTCVTVTQKRREEKRREENIQSPTETVSSSTTPQPQVEDRIPWQEVKAIWNKRFPWRPVRAFQAEMQRRFRARVKQYPELLDLAFLDERLGKIDQSWAKGEEENPKTGKEWRGFNFSWLFDGRPCENWLSGNYDAKERKTGGWRNG